MFLQRKTEWIVLRKKKRQAKERRRAREESRCDEDRVRR